MEENQEKQDAICGEVLRIYETLIDTLQPEYTVPWVEPEFVPGHPCYEAYSGMHNAYGRLRQRLGAEEEDADAEEMIDCLLRMGNYWPWKCSGMADSIRKCWIKRSPMHKHRAGNCRETCHCEERRSIATVTFGLLTMTFENWKIFENRKSPVPGHRTAACR